MAQGKLRKKMSLPGGVKSKMKSQHQQRRKAATGLKKGARFIAPKKTHKLQAAKLKKNLQKTINSNIEKEVAARAASQEGKRLNIVGVPKGNLSGQKKQ